MARNIIVCSDGTGNTANKGRGTNVFKLYEAVDVSRPDQIALYDDGVGTQKLRICRLAAGAVGYGVSRNVKQLYADICRVYSPGDRVHLFGFSRGAFTVRTLAGFIDQAGILDVAGLDEAELRAAVSAKYRGYRKVKPAVIERGLGFLTRGARAMRNAFSPPPSSKVHDDSHEVEFVGAWDTVDAVGFPIWGMDLLWNKLVYRFKFTNTDLPKGVRRARHALAIDEERGPFTPLLWEEPKSGPADRLEQVWFAGVHSDIGGGYPKQGLSMITLDWMMSEASERGEGGGGVIFRKGVRDQYATGGNADGHIHDSRAGAGIYYRYKPRAIHRLVHSPLPAGFLERVLRLFRRSPSPTRPVELKIHHTAIDRVRNRTQGYAPGNLPPRFAIVGSDAHEREIDLEAPSAGAAEGKAAASGSLDRSSWAAPFAATRKWLSARRWIQVGFFIAQGVTVIFAFALSAESSGDPTESSKIWNLIETTSAKIPGSLPYPREESAAAPGLSGNLSRLGGWLYGVCENAVAPVPGTFVQERLLEPLFGYPALGIAFAALFPFFYLLGFFGRTRMEAIQTKAWLGLESRLRPPADEDSGERSAVAI